MKLIAALLTVYNRKQKTLKCLEQLFYNKLPDGYLLDVYLVDDGSTDGTAEAVKSNFPQVNVITGSGNLFWNRGMHRAWEESVATKKYDFYLWLNDDTFIFDDTLEHLLACSEELNHKSIVCGSLCSENDCTKVTYGPRTKKSLIIPDGTLQEAFLINGNVVLVPKVVYKKVGMLDPIFPHAIGDFDYGLRAKRKGFKSYSTKKFIGTCENNVNLPKWCYAKTPIRERFKALYSPLGNAHPKYFFIYENRNFGFSQAFKHYISIHLRVILPQLWK
ncbi:Glycosyltransferase, GT2 family [Pustulibacterium marinum]|uniref:Glycosyltransferase, GT2 family n=1 Tax=Pustulibacterium marinum TaxID=1224947 RepID=A0A1I7F203_9FLAO|nr:glycosyltransferase family 2 protein [Pustulibacterium marinum]SFU30186.1 Glycosyltransferase, GT2 family [Pustulibacterium marinum]